MGHPIGPSVPRLHPSPEICLSIEASDVVDPLVGSILHDPVSVDLSDDFFLSPPLEPVVTAALDDHGTVVSASDAAPDSAGVAVADCDELGDFLLDAVAWL